MKKKNEEEKISIVLPLYNEESIIEKNVAILSQYLKENYMSFEIILGNDGSTDNTLEVIKRLSDSSVNIKYVSHFPNKGRGSILKTAFKIAEGFLIGYIDADLEIKPSYILNCTNEIKNGFDIAIASKNVEASKVSRSIGRTIACRSFAFLTRVLLKSNVKDHQGGLKIFRRTVLYDLLPLTWNDGWAWDTEIIVKAQWKNYSVSEVPFKMIFVRKSKLKLFSDTVKIGVSLIRLYIERIKEWR